MDAREQLAAWMIEHSFATGHGDTFEALLGELGAQVGARLEKLRRTQDALWVARKYVSLKAVYSSTRFRELAERDLKTIDEALEIKP